MTAQAAHTHRPGEFASAAVRLKMMNAVLAQNWWAVAIRGVAVPGRDAARSSPAGAASIDSLGASSRRTGAMSR